ncbi:MAG: stage V sporulation protein D [Sarcina sp.]
MKNFSDNATLKKRILIAGGILLSMILALMIRVSYVMIFNYDEYSKMAIDQWTSDVKISAKRGKILDRNGEELAVSGNVYRVDIDLKAVTKYNKENGTTNEELAKKLSSSLEMEEDKVLKQLNFRLPSGAPAQSAILARRIEKEMADNVKKLNIGGIMVSPDTVRYYPNDSILAHVIGSTNSDGKGLTGVELMYDKELAGSQGVRITERTTEVEDDESAIISRFIPPVDGNDVILTIDLQIQEFLEKAAKITHEKNNADTVSIIAMDPRNGEILGLVNYPNFDLNDPYEGFESFSGTTQGEQVQKMWRNRAVSDTFEPGSIFKVITATAAMEEGLVYEDEIFHCSGAVSINGGRPIKCWKKGGHGDLTFEGIVQNSCNPGFMKLGERLGAEKLTEYIKRYGLGKKSGVDLPGEADGIIKRVDKITDQDLATISFGQTNTVNMIQFMAAFNAIANGGDLIQPHIMKNISSTNEDGSKEIKREFTPIIKSNIISKETTNEFRDILESVVIEGGAKNSYIEGYKIGGKTGTAQKVKETGGYGGGYVASYISMVPTDDPKLTLFVSIDNPKGGAYYGGVIATPVAKMVYEDIFNYLKPSYFNASKDMNYDIIIPEVRGMKTSEAKKILKESGLKYSIEGEDEYISDMLPKAGYTVGDETEIKLYTGGSSNYNKDVIVPSFIGYSKEMAKSLIDKIGLNASFDGEGTIVKQSQEEGSVVRKGDTITFTLTAD